MIRSGDPRAVELTQRFWGTQGRIGFVRAGDWRGRWVFVYPDNAEEWWTIVVAPPLPPDTWGDHYISGHNVLLDIVRDGEIEWMVGGPAEEKVERELFGWRPLRGPYRGLLPDGRSPGERAPRFPLLVFGRDLRPTLISGSSDPGGELFSLVRAAKATFDREGHLLWIPSGAADEVSALERVPGEVWHPSISWVVQTAEALRQKPMRRLRAFLRPRRVHTVAEIDMLVVRAVAHDLGRFADDPGVPREEIVSAVIDRVAGLLDRIGPVVSARWPSVTVVELRAEAPRIIRFEPTSPGAAHLDVVDEGYMHVFGPGRFERELATEAELIALLTVLAEGRLVRWRLRLLPFVVRADIEGDRPSMGGGRMLWVKGSRFASW